MSWVRLLRAYFPLGIAAPSGGAPDTATAAPMATTMSTASCSTVSLSITRKRTNSCLHDELWVNHYTNRTPDGNASFDYYNTIYLDPASDEFSQVTTIRLKSMSGVMNTVNLDYRAKCRGYCNITSVNWDGSKIFKKGDTVQRTITTRFKWTPSGATKNTITPYWYFGGIANTTPIANPLEVEKAKLDIRCDSEVPNAGTGCVFSGYDPTYVMNSKKFPGAAAHIDMMWRKTNIDWGNRNGGKPLTYLGNKMSVDGSGKIQLDRNRQLICGRQWKTYKDRAPETPQAPTLSRTAARNACRPMSGATPTTP